MAVVSLRTQRRWNVSGSACADTIELLLHMGEGEKWSNQPFNVSVTTESPSKAVVRDHKATGKYFIESNQRLAVVARSKRALDL